MPAWLVIVSAGLAAVALLGAILLGLALRRSGRELRQVLASQAAVGEAGHERQVEQAVAAGGIL